MGYVTGMEKRMFKNLAVGETFRFHPESHWNAPCEGPAVKVSARMFKPVGTEKALKINSVFWPVLPATEEN
jgi:hypothetical protein